MFSTPRINIPIYQVKYFLSNISILYAENSRIFLSPSRKIGNNSNKSILLILLS